MPFCPKCRDEFQDWVKTCPDCRVRLVEGLRPESGPTPKGDRPWRPFKSAKTEDEPVLLASARNEPEARMWAGILEDQGIRCMVKTYSSEMFRGVYPSAYPIQPSTLQFDVLVLESDLERAREILGNP
jgi:Putative prokaryotic signal transducing protein